MLLLIDNNSSNKILIYIFKTIFFYNLQLAQFEIIYLVIAKKILLIKYCILKIIFLINYDN